MFDIFFDQYIFDIVLLHIYHILQRLRLLENNQADITLEAMTNQNSGVLTTAMKGDGLAIVKANTCGEAAQQVEFLPYASYGV